MNFFKFKVTPETLKAVDRRKKIINFLLVTAFGIHSYRTYLTTTAAEQARKERETVELRYTEFLKKLSSDEWIQGLETHIRSKKEKDVKNYVRGIYTSIDKDWSGPNPNYIEGLGPII